MTNLVTDRATQTGSFWVTVTRNSPADLQEAVKQVFDRRIAPLYGPQDTQVGRLLDGQDRKVRLLFVPERSDKAAGVLAYKKELVSEEEGCDNAFEVKTATLTDPEEFKGCGRLLLERAERAARSRQAECIQLTVAGDQKPERQAVKRWFEHNGFQWMREMPEGTYRAGEVEIVLKKPLLPRASA
jgi:hypothetical protein